EDIYFGKAKISDERVRAKLRGLFEYIYLLRPPQSPRAHAPFKLLAELGSLVPSENAREFVEKRLRRYGYRVDEYLLEKAEKAKLYALDFGAVPRVKVQVELEEREKEAIQALIERAGRAADGEEVQAAIFEEARRRGINPPQLFSKIYLLLLGRPSGPRLGPYLFDIGADRLREALASLSSK
ncbi:MAG: hypothetical protein QW815_09235, partial [Nitrososphaerota archaeon]